MMATGMLAFSVLSTLLLVHRCTSTTPYDDNAPKVELALYYESLCPDCQQFIAEQLYPTYTKIGEIFNLTLIPYGNDFESKEGGQWKFDCQHGKEECVGNVIETCAISLLKNITVSFPFVHCFEKNINDKDPHTVAKQCAEDLDIDYSPIDACQSGSLGNRLEHEMALKTDALEPKHNYVPWITLNGKHTEKIQDEAEDNLLKLVCEYYTGPKPSACKDVHASRCYRKPFIKSYRPIL
jgi:interferon gamma-inducible protein 30